MRACVTCGCYVRGEGACPHCGASGLGTVGKAGAAVLLGLTLVGSGCVGQALYGVPDTAAQAEYGVADTGRFSDDDEDGWSEVDGDCDDADATVHPEAEEVAGDGVDSDCDGADDT